MNSKVESTKSKESSGLDVVKYIVAILLIAGGIFAFYWFENVWQSGLRIAAVIAAILAAAALFMTTTKGRATREFLSETRFELRKVVWPSRQDAMRLTWIVIIVVIVISLILGGFDLIIQWLLKLFLKH